MFAALDERQMHRIRWAVTVGWLLLIASLFYDPISPWLTDPSNQLSPLRIKPETCVKVQINCFVEIPYAWGAPIFWGIVVPAAIFMLLVFGHEFWRRICPLSFLSQIPRALGWQRQRKRVDAKTGKVRYELVKVAKNSWIARHHLYLQFGLLYLGLCSRILFVDSDRLAEIWKPRPAQGLAADLFDVVSGKKSFESIADMVDDLAELDAKTVENIRREYAIAPEEEEEILRKIEPPSSLRSLVSQFEDFKWESEDE